MVLRGSSGEDDSMTEGTHTAAAGQLQKVAALVAVSFLLAGVAGFIPGLTSDLGDLELYGHESGAQLLGLFEVSVLHNFIHLGFGAAGLLLAKTWDGARAYLVYGGVLYLLVAAYGWVVDHDHDANFVPLDRADNWLHLGAGAGMVALGLLLSRTGAPRAADASHGESHRHVAG